MGLKLNLSNCLSRVYYTRIHSPIMLVFIVVFGISQERPQDDLFFHPTLCIGDYD